MLSFMRKCLRWAGVLLALALGLLASDNAATGLGAVEPDTGLSVFPAGGAAWVQIGPFGGDVRSLAARPGDFSRLLLGTSDSQVYASFDGGRSWAWLAQLGERSDYVIDHILFDPVDPNVIYAAAWSTEPNGGGVFKSSDGGRSWRALAGIAGQSVRSLVQAPGDPRLLVAGSLQGVFRSRNAGQTWERISPAYHEEIRNIESLAIDPKDPDVIYAGTWHLPWKTTDGGNYWFSIKNGIIDDSDMFSIVVDWSNNGKLYASACSGIYGSNSAGRLWRKIQGIPHSARRTRVIKQHPKDPSIVYAGTTEGLWKTESGGDSWRRLTSPKLIVNDLAIDPRDPQHVLLGTDRAGVLASWDGGETFTPANQGFAHRQVSGTAYDPAAGRLYVGVLNDKEYGGVYYTEDAREWKQANAGLDDADVFAMIYARTPQGGRLLAAARQGILALDAEKNTWSVTGRVVGRAPEPPRPVSSSKKSRAAKNRAVPQSGISERVPPSAAKHPDSSRAISHETGPYLKATVNGFFQAAPDQLLYAATNSGAFKSADAGVTWAPISPRFPVTAIAADGNFLVAGGDNGLELSFNGGVYWFHIYLPTGSLPAHVNALALSGKLIMVASEAGLLRSPDRGATWERKGRGMPVGPVSGLRIRPGNANEIYATARITGNVYVSEDSGQTFRALERQGLVGYRLGTLDILPRRESHLLVVASAFDGLFARPLPALAASSSSTSAAVKGQ
jgi:photosystem II stability/assembly factor-like uncharacterized protein